MAKPVSKRSEIAPEHRWRLEDIFPSDVAWETAFEGIAPLTEKLEGFRGRLADGPTLLACLRLETDLSFRMMELFTYARMRRDEDEG